MNSNIRDEKAKPRFYRDFFLNNQPSQKKLLVLRGIGVNILVSANKP